MDKILHYLKDPKLWELRYIPYYGSCRILSISRSKLFISTVIIGATPLSLAGFKGGCGLAASEHLEHGMEHLEHLACRQKTKHEIISGPENHAFQSCSTLNKCKYLSKCCRKLVLGTRALDKCIHLRR